VNLDAKKIHLIMELRRSWVSDTSVLSAIELTPREFFMSEALRDRAYDNVALPIDCGQTISQPLVVGVMTQALRVEERMRVLEVGTGSGYQSAILSRLCRRVYTIERYKRLMTQAEKRFTKLGHTNITTRVGDGSKGWQEQAPISRILVTAAATDVPPDLADQLEEDGIMIVPVGDEYGDQQVLRVTRTADGFDHEELLPVRFVPLVEGELDSKPDDSESNDLG
jgi:protein-L-isoaspartate(D-aspartate) O-methyltransferase